MADIPESLLRRSAEAKAKALGLPVEQVLAEMKGEAPPPTQAPSSEEPVSVPEETPDARRQTPAETPEPAGTRTEDHRTSSATSPAPTARAAVRRETHQRVHPLDHGNEERAPD